MKIIAYFITYNEIDLLPLQHKWCKNQGIEMYVIDNCSNDGTVSYLKKNNIRHHFIDTNGAFDLRPLLAEITKQIHRDKPDWFIYTGMDMFFVDKDLSVKQMIVLARNMKYNMISMQQITFYHTSLQRAQKPEQNPFNTNFHYRENQIRTFISAYHPDIFITPDKINHPVPDTFVNRFGYIFEMNAGKPIANRIENLKRREKAWKEGLPRKYGHHYLALASRGFIYPENEQTDIRLKEDIFPIYQKLQNCYETD